MQELWAGDLLDRSRDARFIIDFIKGRVNERGARGVASSYVLNIDSAWGSGKTYFLKNLDAQLRNEGHISVYVDAWRDDHASDPLLPVLSAFEESLKPYIKKNKTLDKMWKVARDAGLKIAVTAAQHAAKSGIRKILGEGIEDITKIISEQPGRSASEICVETEKAIGAGVDAVLDDLAKNALQSFREERKSMQFFRERMWELSETLRENQRPIFVLIDELDRCRPNYSILLLERVKHLFSTENCAFIIATDSAQLKHSIKAVYGELFDSSAYLRRFFDRTYQFAIPSIDKFVEQEWLKLAIVSEKFQVHQDIAPIKFFCDGFNNFEVSLRDIEQCVDILHTIATMWRYDVKINAPFLLWLVVAYQRGNDTLWSALCDSSDAEFATHYANAMPDWKIKMHIYDGNNLRQQDVPVSSYILKLIQIMHLSDTRLYKLTEARDGLQAELTRAASQEREVLRYEVSGAIDKSKGLLVHYPEMVKNAGRLKLPP